MPYPFPRGELTEPAPLYRRLRREWPVCRVRLPSGDPAWLVTRYADARLVLADPRFSKRALLEIGAARTRRGTLLSGLLFTTDPPEHTVLRSRLTGAFTPRRMAELRPRIAELAERLLDRLEPGGDLMRVFVEPLAMSVIRALLGLRTGDNGRYAYWAEVVLSVNRFPDDEVTRAQRDLLAHVGERVRAVRAAPDEGLIAVLAAEDPDDVAVAKLAATLLATGYETMVAAIGNALLTLFVHCGRLPFGSANPELLEELLRFATFGDPLRSRRAIADVELGGVLIRAGDVVMVSIASANRDADVFDEPERFDPGRPCARHLSFGHGPHYCVGAALARVELEVVLEVLARRLPTARLAVPFERIRLRYGTAEAPPESLPITW